MQNRTLSELWARGTAFLGCEHAILGGAMSWVSESNLVSALSNAGAFGVIAASAMPPQKLEEEIIKTKAKLLRSPLPLREGSGGGVRAFNEGQANHPAGVNHGYSERTQIYAKDLRKEPTDAENALWKLLRSRQMEGCKFRRQQPIGHYIADFFCPDAKLIIELDGGQHAEQQARYDAERTAFLEKAGYRVLRFWNNDVLGNTEGVWQTIETALRKTPGPPTQPSPSRGEGFKPFGVNLIIMHPQLAELIEVCKRQNVSHVVLAGGIPKSVSIDAIKAYGAKVICFAPSAGVGRKLVKMGADALVIEGMEAGGHIGPVSTSVLAQEILPVIRDVPVFVAGGIGRGEAIASYLQMGASGVQLGTRFVCSDESIAHAKFKEAFIRAAARDAIPSIQVDPEFPVIPVRALVNKATDDFIRFQHEVIGKYRSGALDKKAAQLEIEHFWAGALRRAVIDGDVEHGSVMAGQSVGLVNDVRPVRIIISELVAQAQGFLQTGCR